MKNRLQIRLALVTLRLVTLLLLLAIVGVAHAADPTPTPATPMTENPLLKESTLPYQFPPFDQIKDEHFQPAIEQGMQEQLKEVEKIADQKDKATFENTIVALEKSGRLLSRANRIFSNLNGANTNPDDAKDRQGTVAEARRASGRDPLEWSALHTHRDSLQQNARSWGSIRNRPFCSSVTTRISCAPARSCPTPTRQAQGDEPGDRDLADDV